MSYEPTNWKSGDVVTSAKLNKLENAVANGGSTVVLQITEDSGILHLGKSYNDLKAMADSGMNVVAIWKQNEEQHEDYYRWYPLTELSYSNMFSQPYSTIFGFSFDEDSLGFASSAATDELIMQL